jgi:hypothetical protein
MEAGSEDQETKKCEYCGLANEATQQACSRCGTPFGHTPYTAEQWATVVMGAGMVIQILARYIAASRTTSPPKPDRVPGALASVVVMVLGCTRYASLKGYSPLLGALGLLSCVGALVLYLLPKRPIDAGEVKGSIIPPGDG